jgi:predicted phage terminase large subunit-like protein
LLSEHDLQFALQNLHRLDPIQKERVLTLLEERKRLARLQEARDHFIPFVKMMWPEFIPGAHHTIMAEAFEKIATGELKRLIINMPPRFTKSELSSWLLPAWLLGRQPISKIIQASNTEALAAGFGRKVRNLVSGEGGDTDQTTHPFSEVFPNVWLAKDSQAAAGWHTNRGGEYFAIGVNGKVTGKGANCAYFSCKCLTKRGYIQIADVRVGDEVLGYDHKRKRTVWTRVRAVSTQRKPELVNINGFIGTPDHRVYTRRGYRRSLAVRENSDAVLTLPENLRTGLCGVPSIDPTNREGAYTPVLLGRVPEKSGDVHMPAMRGLESANGRHLQSLLPEGQARRPDVPELRQRLPAASFHASQERSFIRGRRQRFLQPQLLSDLQSGNTCLAANTHWQMQNLRRAGAAGGREVLLASVLSEAGEKTRHAVRGGLEPGTSSHQETVQRRLRNLRPGEGPRAGSPYRSRLDEPHGGEFDLAVRAVPLVLPQGDVGRCARDYEGALRGEGHWVVDIQTDTENFFCEGILVHNCAIIDDAHSEQEAKQAESNPAVFDTVWEWYSSGIRQRLQPGGAIVIPMTRWSKRDLSGRLIKQMQEADGIADKWEVISFPAILDEGQPTERSMWPGFWPLEELQRTRAALPVAKWAAQYMQQPTSEGAAIIKREYWRKWGGDNEKCPGPAHAAAWDNLEPPACDYIIGSWDCAATKNERSHPSAYTLWGVFKAEDPDTGKEINNIILLSSFTGRMEFPELKKKAKQFYEEDRPDTLLIENKSAGMQLLQEFRSMGIPAEDFSGSSRGTRAMPNDKIARANLISDIFASRFVWAPERRFAEELIEQAASFPNGDADDLVDSTVQAMIRFRAGGFIRTANDEVEDDEPRTYRRKRMY